jgi:hypothetical protein
LISIDINRIDSFIKNPYSVEEKRTSFDDD